MKRSTNSGWTVALLAAAALACRTAPVPPPGAAGPAAGAAEAEPANSPAGEELGAEGFGEGLVAAAPLEEPLEEPEDLEAAVEANLKTVYFDLDSSALDEEAKRILEENARWLLAHPEVRIVVEGHCDERGTVEYNLELGQRRARAVREYLIRLGVDGDRIGTISYGELRPADPGHGESAWARNRRAEFRAERK
ncbi:MAG: peptidoglycan-associated lipoprotein Pal [Acidobacteria bacterium]|nr:MAG: peptidoglycan-associated lipoprotein Pal [Acidobacteriota bacterium]